MYLPACKPRLETMFRAGSENPEGANFGMALECSH